MRRFWTGANLIWGGVLALIVGIAIAAMAVVMVRAAQPLDGGTTTTGRVVSLERRGRVCSPIVRYRVGDRTYETSSELRSRGACGYEEGEAMEVSYLPENPADGRVVEPAAAWIWLFVALGTALGLFGLVTLVRGGRRLVTAGKERAAGHTIDPAAAHLFRAQSDGPPLPLPPPAAPAAWLPDPTGSGNLRWWDGSRWTDHTHPAATEPGPAPGSDRAP